MRLSCIEVEHGTSHEKLDTGSTTMTHQESSMNRNMKHDTGTERKGAITTSRDHLAAASDQGTILLHEAVDKTADSTSAVDKVASVEGLAVTVEGLHDVLVGESILVHVGVLVIIEVEVLESKVAEVFAQSSLGDGALAKVDEVSGLVNAAEVVEEGLEAAAEALSLHEHHLVALVIILVDIDVGVVIIVIVVKVVPAVLGLGKSDAGEGSEGSEESDGKLHFGLET